MLPPFIIEQIRQREERERESRREQQRPRLELPIERLPAPQHDPDAVEDDPDRGVVIVDLMG
jgi:hypothetical protein